MGDSICLYRTVRNRGNKIRLRKANESQHWDLSRNKKWYSWEKKKQSLYLNESDISWWITNLHYVNAIVLEHLSGACHVKYIKIIVEKKTKKTYQLIQISMSEEKEMAILLSEHSKYVYWNFGDFLIRQIDLFGDDENIFLHK